MYSNLSSTLSLNSNTYSLHILYGGCGIWRAQRKSLRQFKYLHETILRLGICEYTLWECHQRTLILRKWEGYFIGRNLWHNCKVMGLNILERYTLENIIKNYSINYRKLYKEMQLLIEHCIYPKEMTKYKENMLNAIFYRFIFFYLDW